MNFARPGSESAKTTFSPRPILKPVPSRFGKIWSELSAGTAANASTQRISMNRRVTRSSIAGFKFEPHPPRLLQLGHDLLEPGARGRHVDAAACVFFSAEVIEELAG